MELRKKNQESARFGGLSEREAKSALARYGPNTLTQGKKIRPYKILLQQFKDVLIIILLVSTVLSVLMGQFTDAVAIIAIVFLNAVLGFIQEYRTERTLEALRKMAAPTARVVRGGQKRSVPASDVVPRDMIVLEAGDRVPSDAKLIEAEDLQADESLLTGESVPAEKGVNAAGGHDRVYMGTMITRGRGRALTVATGMDTEMGKIADMLTGIGDEQTPLQKRLDQLGKYIAIACLVICALVSVTGILRGEPVFSMILTGISLAVAAVPEGLPAIVTISLALGVRRMLKRHALIRRLPAVETLGCATVVCSDKTGTLTENRMTVRRVATPEHTYDADGPGDRAEGGFRCSGRRVSAAFQRDLGRALEIAAVCNNAEVSRPRAGGFFRRANGKKTALTVSGDPTEAALLVAALKAGLSPQTLAGCYRRYAEIPFDSERKCMSVAVKTQDGRRLLFSKGAPDVILEKCSFYESRGTPLPLDSAVRRRLLSENDAMAAGALRVLAVAWRELSPAETGRPDRGAEHNLVFSGLVGMIDPPRPEAFDAVKKCRRAGIRPVMITGDHKNTAAAIAGQLGILGPGDRVLTGAELDSMGDAELLRDAPRTSVYARVSPGHKLRIVRCYKKLGNIVAMTGDGVNDAPAVKEADIGVSMGKTGTDVTKEASSIILLDDNFASMVAAIEEGRVIYSNIRKFIRYLISCNIGEVLTMFGGMLMGMPVVLLPIQILWINLVTDGLPAMALCMEPAEKDIMEQEPRSPDEGVFSGGLLTLILFRGFIIGLCTLGTFVSVLGLSRSVETARTAAFLVLVFVQLVHVFECKSEHKNLLHIPFFNNVWLLLAVLCSSVMILGVVFWPPARAVFSTTALTFRELLIAAGYIAVGPVLSGILFTSHRHLRRRKRRRA